MKDDYTTNFHNLTTFDFKGDGRTYFLSLGVKADSVAETPLENQSSVSVPPVSWNCEYLWRRRHRNVATQHNSGGNSPRPLDLAPGFTIQTFFMPSMSNWGRRTRSYDRNMIQKPKSGWHRSLPWPRETGEARLRSLTASEKEQGLITGMKPHSVQQYDWSVKHASANRKIQYPR